MPAPSHPPRPIPARRALRLVVAAPLLALLTLAAAGCATMVNGRYQQVPVASAPSGALVEVDGTEQCHTPCVVRVTRHDNHTIRVASPGYEATGITLRRELTGWAWLNILNGGLPGISADATTGGLYELAPRKVDLTLAAGDGDPPRAAARP